MLVSLLCRCLFYEGRSDVLSGFSGTNYKEVRILEEYVRSGSTVT